jgi:hypothetical protein
MRDAARVPSHPMRRLVRWVIIAVLAVWLVRILLLIARA